MNIGINVFRPFLCVIAITENGIIISKFFFSSRRRHTRCSRDWSSDVWLFRSETGMHMTAATLGLAAATFLASAVEFVEAFTIVLAMGLSRSWRAALTGTAAAVLALTTVTAIAGVALIQWISESMLQLVIGTLLLLFGLQWLRTAILRAGGLATLHDERAAFRTEQEAARLAGHQVRLGLDWVAFVVSFKGVFLEGLEVAFIVITFGL